MTPYTFARYVIIMMTLHNVPCQARLKQQEQEYKCTWHEHINYITSKACKNIRHAQTIFASNKIYISFVRPTLECTNIVWDSCTQYEIKAIERIQIEAARIVTGATRLVS